MSKINFWNFVESWACNNWNSLLNCHNTLCYLICESYTHTFSCLYCLICESYTHTFSCFCCLICESFYYHFYIKIKSFFASIKISIFSRSRSHFIKSFFTSLKISKSLKVRSHYIEFIESIMIFRNNTSLTFASFE